MVREIPKKARHRPSLSGSRLYGKILDDLFVILIYVFVTLIAATMLYPFLNILAVSFSDHTEYVKNPWMLIPKGFNLKAYKMVFNNKQIYTSYGNTIYITFMGTIISLIVTVLTAYPLSRRETKGKGVIMTLLIFTMVFNAGMIPNFLNIRNLGLYNTHWALILPGTLSVYHCILMINFFKKVSISLIEAAKIDGASEPFILTRIIIPLSLPVLATITLFKAVGLWNNYFSAQIYLKNRELWPLALLLKEILLESKTALLQAEGNVAEIDLSDVPTTVLQYATLIVSVVPIMCIYPFLQKYFAKGIMLGSVKE
jgi:putative aldouronate transport system permease protein